MQTAKISNINFKGIILMNPNMQNLKTPQSQVIDDTLKRLDEISSLNDSIHIKTISDYFNEISDALQQKEDEESEKIKKKYCKFYNFFLKQYKLKKLKASIQQEQALLKKNVSEDSNIDVKKELLASMLRILDEGMAKVNELDIQMSETTRKIKRREDSDEVINKAQRTQGFSSVGGYEPEKDLLYEAFIQEVEKEKAGLPCDVTSGVLFYGPWGNGKTHITRNVAAQTGCRIVEIDCSYDTTERYRIMNDLYKQAQAAKEHFEKTNLRTILFIDEADEVINKNSPIKEEFEQFIKTCSEKYHCTVFAATNSPSRFGVNLNDSEVFPIRVSIEAPDIDNMAGVIKNCLKSVVKDNVDFDEVANELYKKQTMYGACYNNGQITELCSSMLEELGTKDIAQDKIIDYIRNCEIIPELKDSELEDFEREYKIFEGEEKA